MLLNIDFFTFDLQKSKYWVRESWIWAIWHNISNAIRLYGLWKKVQWGYSECRVVRQGSFTNLNNSDLNYHIKPTISSKC